MKKLLLISTAVVALASGAQAADLGVPRAPVAAAVVAPVFSWNGVYIGVQAGYSWGHATATQYTAGTNTIIDVSRYSPNGFVGGVHIGYNHQINNFVLGLEADLEGAGINGRFTYLNGDVWRSRISVQGSVRARLGVAVDRALLYVTGGVALSNLQDSAIDAAGVSASRSGRAGWTAGAGVEYAFTPNWTARVEYRYTDYGSRRFNLAPAAGTDASFRNNNHTVRLGVSYLFSTGPSAVVARY